jgi:hypothetical protein
MIELKTMEKFNIKGRGTVFTAKMSENPQVDFKTLIHRFVVIEGQKYRVVGLEHSDKNGFVADGVGVVVSPAP